MKLEGKIKEIGHYQDGNTWLLMDMEDFFVMLDRVSPRVPGRLPLHPHDAGRKQLEERRCAMKLQLKADGFSILPSKGKKVRLEVLVGQEDLFEMLDEASPKVMADYMMHRLRDCFEQKRENRGAKFHERYGKEDELW